MSTADIATIGLAVDTSGVKAGVNELDNLAAASTKVEHAAAGLRGVFSGVGQAFKEGVSSGVADARKEIEQIETMMKNPQLRMDVANNARKALGVRGDAEITAEIEATRKAYDDLKATGLATASELNRAKDSMKHKIGELREEMGKWNGDWDALGKKAQEVGGKMQSAGMYLAGAGAVGVGAIGTTVKAYSDLEASSAILKSTMMTTEGISKNFERMNALAVELGNKMPGTTNDFNVMLSKLLQLGVSEEAVLGGVGTAAANLAIVMKVPYEQAAEMTAKLKEAMGVSESDMLSFMDTIQRVGHQGVDPSQMMYAFARSAGALKQFGIQGEESSRQIAGLYAQLIKLGASGETVGTSFNSALNAMAKWEFGMLGDKRSAEVDDELKRLGITLDFFDDKTKQFKGVDNMIAQLDKLKNIDTESLQKIMGGMFGGGADQQFMIALSKGGTAAATAMQEKMASQADISKRVESQLDTLAAKWEAATGTFQNFLASIGSTIAPQLKSVVDWFGELSAAGQKFVTENPELAKWLGLIVGGASVAALGAGTTLIALGSAIKGIGLALPLISAGWAGAVAFFSNPLVLAIAGVTAAAYGGYKIGEFFNEQINSIITAISDGKFVSLGDVLYEGMHGPNGLITILEKIPSFMSSLGEKFKKAGSDLMQYFRDGIQAGLKFSLGIGDKLAEAVAYIKNTAAQWKQIGIDLIMGLWEGMKATIRKPIEAVQQLAKDLPAWARDILGMHSPSLVFKEIGENIGEGMELGILSSIPDVQAAAEKMSKSAITGGYLRDYEPQVNYGKNFSTIPESLLWTSKQSAMNAPTEKELEALARKAEILKLQLRDPLDEALDKFAEYDLMLQHNLISQKEYAAAIAETTLAMEKYNEQALIKKDATASKVPEDIRNAQIVSRYRQGQTVKELARYYEMSESKVLELIRLTNEADTVFGKLRLTVEDAFKTMEGSFLTFIKTGKLEFSGFVDAIIDGLEQIVADMATTFMREQITPMMNMGVDWVFSLISGLFSAKGNAFSDGIHAFATGGVLGPMGGLLTQPTVFPMANGGIGIGGEAGTEAVLPLTRDASGVLGVRSSGGNGGNNVIVNVVESPGNGGQTRERNEGGTRIVDVIVEQIKAAVAHDFMSGGNIAKSAERTYGLNRAAGAF
jgi:TP901 family phage tail tape measure protein